MDYPEDRRFKSILVGYRALFWSINFARQMRHQIDSEESPLCVAIEEIDLPDDVKIVSVHDDPLRRGLLVILHSINFDEVPFGQIIPHLGEATYRVAKFKVMAEC